MTKRHYLAIAARAQDATAWCITFPAIPALTVIADRAEDAVSKARAAVEAMIREASALGGQLPLSIEEGSASDFDPALFHESRGFLVEVDISGTHLPAEVGGQQGPEPTRYGDWEKNGRCTDF